MPLPKIEIYIDSLQVNKEEINQDDAAASLDDLFDYSSDIFASVGEKLTMLFSAIHPNQTMFASPIQADEFELEIGFSFEASTGGPIKLIIDGKGGATCTAKVKWKRQHDLRTDCKNG